MTREVYEVHAFTANGENGQPAGVVVDADDLDVAQMETITREAGFTETAFVSTSASETYRVRFFSTENELDLCGHATIATWSLLLEKGLVLPGKHTQETGAGPLGIEMLDNGLVFMQQADPIFSEKFGTQEVASLLGLDATDIRQDLPSQIVYTGIRDLFVPVVSKDVLPTVDADLERIIEFSRQHDISAVHVFSIYEAGESIVSARNFAPIDGIDEEAATGTSNGGLLCYLREYKQLPDDKEVYQAEQGEVMGQLSHIFGKFATDGSVWIGGKASVVGQRSI
jgi:PhzF family phenazine biosynthesis protein